MKLEKEWNEKKGIKRGLYRESGVGERACQLMAISWPLNGWFKKNKENLWKEQETKGFAHLQN